MREGPVPLEVTPLVWVFLSVLSVVVLISIVIGATFRVSSACSTRFRSKDVPSGSRCIKEGSAAAAGGNSYSSYSEAATNVPGGGGGHQTGHVLKLSPEKMRNNPDIIQDTGTGYLTGHRYRISYRTQVQDMKQDAGTEHETGHR
jgi:hypothetical protein